MKFAEIEQKIEDFFKLISASAGPSAVASINAARSIVGLGMNVGKEAVKGLIESGQYAASVNAVRGVVVAGVVAILPGPLRWIPFVRPGRVVERLFDWLIEQEPELAASVGAKIPATPA